MKKFNNGYDFGNTTEDLFMNKNSNWDNNNIDSNSVNGISMYPYNNFNDAVLAELRLHEENKNNPHEVTCNQIKAVSFDVNQTKEVDSTEQFIARKNIGLDRIVNTSDTDEAVLDSTKKFTSGGAFKLKQKLAEQLLESKNVESNLDERLHKLENDKIDVEQLKAELKEYIREVIEELINSNNGE